MKDEFNQSSNEIEYTIIFIPEEIKKEKPEPALRPKGLMAAMAQAVVNDLREQEAVRKSREKIEGLKQTLLKSRSLHREFNDKGHER